MNKPFIKPHFHFVDQQGEDYGERENDKHFKHADQKRIPERFQKSWHIKQINKVLKADERASRYAFKYAKILECYNRARHGRVVE